MLLLMFLPVLFFWQLLVSAGFAAPIGIEKSADEEGQTSSTSLASEPTTMSPGMELARVFIMQMFDKVDSDANGVLSYDEFARNSSKKSQDVKFLFQVYDFNGDGHLTREEFLAMLDVEKMARRMFDLMDWNKDGWLIKAELEDHVDLFGGQEMLNVRFNEMDTNQDGRLSLEEYIQDAKKEQVIVKMHVN